MTSRAVSTRDGSRVPSTARLLLGGALVLGFGATIVLVMSDDARFLKLGIVAALWAALLGVFLAARFRRQVSDGADNAADMQAVYELELEREIAARREYELELEAEAKRKADDESRQDIEALRTELGALRETLQSLLGGEVLVERLALQATRMRSIGDDGSQLPRQNQVKRLNASPREQVVVPSEPQTELMERVVERPHQPSRRPPTQRSQRSERSAPREPDRPVRPSVVPREQRVDPSDPGSGWWEPVIPPGHATPRQEAYHRPVAGDPGQSLGEGLDPNWTPSWERSNPAQPGRPPRPPKAPQASQPLPKRPQASQPLPTPPQASQPLPTPAASPQARPTDAITRVQPPVNESPRVEAATRVQQPVAEPLPPPPPPAERRRPDDTSGGRRRAPESEAVPPGRHAEPPEETAGGGRRRRAEDAPSWQDSLGARTTGSHAKPAPPAEPTGSHTEGRSVSELLAAHGTTENPRRRRRRED
ncbi:DUF6779 domain-containing protein [Actinocrispum wychmicini]|uniref:DUF6779 domain-containing protein n=1 Tax=Actinocrispum wychmicini TaxID=1213861 RepID=A0A4R2JG61_9PSEU|nr:DUF6779 domain-containing protein [Actinocrispum wychmicini]TCO57994.1 hypothetical protein EV192_10556 [Actinocrispum wychmicini]